MSAEDSIAAKIFGTLESKEGKVEAESAPPNLAGLSISKFYLPFTLVGTVESIHLSIGIVIQFLSVLLVYMAQYTAFGVLFTLGIVLLLLAYA